MPARVRIFVTCRTCREPLFAALSRIGEVIPSPFRATRTLTEDELVTSLREVDVVVAGTDHFTRRVLAAGASSRLKVLARFGIGLDNVDLEAATESRVVVTYAPKASSVSVAEFAVGLILALLRRIPEADLAVKAGSWPMTSMQGREIDGKTVGVVGLGTIGRRVADTLTQMGARILAYDPYLKDDPRLASLKKLLTSSDVITVHSALTSRNTHLIGEKEFTMMKRGAILVNTARGAILDERALRSALEDGRIAGAALDVLEVEPPSGPHPLARFPNVILTPHVAGNTAEATERTGEVVLEDIRRVLGGRAPLYPANPEVVTALGLKK